ncbi:MAG: hypothetical protein J7J65_03370 [Candidatus Korarchaeota archaeon]|nr:hypothetical protein [Candidatus Korarchaeota archaeon]
MSVRGHQRDCGVHGQGDPNHGRAVKLLEAPNKASSFLALVELASVYSRAGFEDPQALAIYSVEEAGWR